MAKHILKYISKLIRWIIKIELIVSNFFRILFLRLRFPGLYIDFNTTIEKNCKIVCVDGGYLNLRNSIISNGTQIFCDSTARVEISDSFIGRNCCIVAKGGILIKPRCAIAEMVVIRDQNHKINPMNVDLTRNNYEIRPIVIGENVWLGAKVTVLCGVEIGDNAIIAASAVVTKSIPTLEVWGGIPAKFLKKNE